MFWTLIRKEMLEQFLSIRFTVSFVLAFLFLVPTTYILATDYGWLHRELGPREGFEVHWTGELYVLNRNVPALQVLATGLDEVITLRSNNWPRTGRGPAFGNNRHFVHNPLRYLFSQLDFVLFINIIGSLMAFVFTYDAISGEKQRGTLRLIMTNPIPRPLFLLSKFAGNYITFTISLVPALIGVVLVLYIHPDVYFRTSDWGATCFLFLLAWLYLCALFMLGLFVSCVTSTPKTTLTALMTLWVLLVLVIPNFSPFLASKLTPARSVYEIEAQKASIKEDLIRRFQNEAKNLMRGRDWENLSKSEKEAVGRVWKEYDRELMKLGTGKFGNIRLEFLNVLDTQAEVSRGLSLISPSAAFASLVPDIAGTGIFSERGFRRAIFRYDSQYAEYVDRYIKETGDYERLYRVDKNNSPPFFYRELTYSQVIAAHLPHFMVLVLYPVLFFFGAQIIFIRSQL